MKVLLYSLAAFVVLTFTYACSKATLVGSDLFVPDSIELLFRDDFELNASTENIDSVVTYDGTVSISSLVVGELNDPTFGKTIAEGFVELRYGNTNSAPNFVFTKDGEATKVTLDSVVLVMEYDSEGFYGDTTAVHNLEVLILEDEISREDSIFSTQRLASSQIIGSKSFIPAPKDSLFILQPGDTLASGVANQFRMRLDDEWAQAMIDDTSLVSTSEALLEYTAGLHLRSTTDKSSTIGFEFGVFAPGQVPDNNIYVYYTQDTIPSVYRFALTGVKHNYYEHDYSDAGIKDFFGEESKGDSLLFMQGLAGTAIDLDIPVLSNGELDDFVINRMELEFFVLEDETFDIHSPINNIVVQAYDEDGELRLIEDALISFEAGQPLYFGGSVSEAEVNGMTLNKYNAIISLYAIQTMKSMDTFHGLRISSRNNAVTPNRSIIYGPKHSLFPMKLKANYSK